MTDWGITPRAWFRDGKAHKHSALERLARDFPAVRWILIGDDGEHDPELYAAFAQQHPERVAAIALRQVTGPTGSTPYAAGVPVVCAAGGDELLELLHPVLHGAARDARAPGGARTAHESPAGGGRARDKQDALGERLCGRAVAVPAAA